MEEMGKEALDKTAALLKPSARMCVISFHSLEDRIVKRAFKALVASGSFTALTKKPVRPGKKEMDENPRSRSAKLRVIERI